MGSERVPQGNVKVTREDWLTVAMDILVSDGVGEVKVLSISDRLGVSRSSFYWYFKDRQDLLDALLETWARTNTEALVHHAGLPSDRITQAVTTLFRCFVDPDLFDPRLDFAIREWARRDGHVRKIIDDSDERRVAAIAAMFARHGYAEREADTRARILYYMQIGYYALDLSEPMESRLARVADYVFGFTGQAPDRPEIDALAAFSRQVAGRG